MDTIGLLELTSIATGVDIVDKMLKIANVDLIYAKASCPGKYYIMISGNVANVKASIDEGKKLGKGFVVCDKVLSKIHPSVIKALNMSTNVTDVDTLGVLEYYNVTNAIIASDLALKSSNVEILTLRVGTGIGGKSFVAICGETSSVTSAVNTCINTINDGMAVSHSIISRPRKEVVDSLF